MTDLMSQPTTDRFKHFIHTLSPAQFFLTGFLLIALAGALLLALPMSNADGRFHSLVDALFISSSAVSTTGLSVVDIGSFYSRTGQILILLFIQIGGLGYMVFFAIIILILEQKLTFKSGEAIQQSLSAPSKGGVKHYIKKVLLFTFLFEAVGTIALTLYWLPENPFGEALFLGIFHSVSAFCTAGFALFAENFMSYEFDIFVNMVLNILSVTGGIGFLVLVDIQSLLSKVLDHQYPRHLLVHTRLALLTFAALTLFGILIIIFSEAGDGLSFGKRILSATFQALSASSTTGFNTTNITQMSESSLFVLIMLMFIGAPAGGTGGGIKTTTFAVIVLFVWSLLKGQQDVNIFERRIPKSTVSQTVGIGVMAMGWTFIITLLLTFTEQGSFFTILFEVVSALGTVGLSMGFTSSLTLVGKLAIIVTMLIGRVGLLSIGLSLMEKPHEMPFHYPEEEIFVG
jgi:trk system potassium uptake protein TrkH